RRHTRFSRDWSSDVCSSDLATLMAWADGLRRMKVRANAETPADAETALQFGAEGIGLCRTEHMFFDPERIAIVREMILAADTARSEERRVGKECGCRWAQDQ